MSEACITCKPILKWAGGKSGLLPQLLEHFPKEFSRYIEPFLGGGAVFFAVPFSGPSIVNDSNPEIIDLYRVVRDSLETLLLRLDELAEMYSEEFYYEIRSRIPADTIERAARTLFLNKTGFNGLYRQNASGGFNVPFGKRVVCPALYDSLNIRAVSSKLQSCELWCKDFSDVLDQAGQGDFVYCDPPYEPLSKSSSFNSYQGGGFDQSEQLRLKAACVQAMERGATVCLSNSSAPFIKEIYSGFETHTIWARRAINSKAEARGLVPEVLAVLSQESLQSARPSDRLNQTRPS